MTTIDRPLAVAPLARLANADTLVPLVTGEWTRYVDLDAAASTPPLAAVQDALAEFLPYYASVHRGAGWSSRLSTAAYEQSRVIIGDFVGARPDDAVIVTRNTTDALTLLASAVPGPVLHLDLEHHANQLPWRVRGTTVLPARGSWADTLADLDAALRPGDVALVAITGASNVTGECPRLDDVVAIAHRHGARVVVDGAQLVPHRPVDVAALDVDYLAFSGHKIYAPYGAGVLVGRRDWLDAAPPHQPGGGAVARVGVADVEWLASPARHEGGTPNVLGAVALTAACTAVAAIPAADRIAHERTLLARLRDGLAGLGIAPLRLWPDDDLDTVGVTAFGVPGHDPAVVAARLSAEYGIGLRDGRFCAHPLLHRTTGGAPLLRASVGLGTGSADVDALLAALGEVLSAGPRWRYERTPAGWCRCPTHVRVPTSPPSRRWSRGVIPRPDRGRRYWFGPVVPIVYAFHRLSTEWKFCVTTSDTAATPALTGAPGVFARFRRDRWAVTGAIVVLLVAVVALAAPLITAINGQDPYTYDKDALDPDGAALGALGGVSGTHWFGAEPLTGRDLFSIVLYGARTSLLVGLGATVVELVLGTLAGATAALVGGWADRVLSRVIDVLFGFPSLIFMIALGAFSPPWLPKPLLVVLVIGVLGWGSTARVVRSQCLTLMGRNFVLASQAMGAPRRHVLVAQLLPNLAGTLIVLGAVRIPLNIGYEAALSFLGVGVPPPTPAWGRTISSAVSWIATDPWYLLWPAAGLFVVTFAFNLIGDGLRDALDPRLADS